MKNGTADEIESLGLIITEEGRGILLPRANRYVEFDIVEGSLWALFKMLSPSLALASSNGISRGQQLCKNLALELLTA